MSNNTPKIEVWHHADADGCVAALAVLALGKGGICTAVQYGQPTPQIAPETTRIYIVDFCYDTETLESICDVMAERGGSVHVIDHHKTAQAYMNNVDRDNFFGTFNTAISGCELAWAHLHDDIPTLAAYVGDRDMWQWKLPGSNEINLALSLNGLDLQKWVDENNKLRELGTDRLLQLEEVGKALDQFRAVTLDKYLKEAAEVGSAVVVNCTAYTSECGDALLRTFEKAQIAVMWQQVKDGKIIISLRSRIDGPDVSIIAKSFGGGGHRNAAGFGVYGHDTAINYINALGSRQW